MRATEPAQEAGLTAGSLALGVGMAAFFMFMFLAGTAVGDAAQERDFNKRYSSSR
jgi:hypothetical protein